LYKLDKVMKVQFCISNVLNEQREFIVALLRPSTQTQIIPHNLSQRKTALILMIGAVLDQVGNDLRHLHLSEGQVQVFQIYDYSTC
jgi:hypothetical protein